ncbi:MAG TPA: acylphosphatase [Thermoanaerobaculia bacterium]
MIARRLVVSGRVQGVGFRFFAERAARELAVAGWVRNLPNGSVESVAEGEEDAIARYVERLREGPRMGRVTELRVEEIAVIGYRDFEITA